MSKKAELMRESLKQISKKDRNLWGELFWRNLTLLNAELTLEIHDTLHRTKKGENE